MMTQRLQLAAIAVSLLYLAGLTVMLKKRELEVKYSLLFLGFGLVMLVLAVFPPLLDEIAALLGVLSPVNALFLLMICGCVLMLISFAFIASRERRRVLRLAQELALLEKRLRSLEEKEAEHGTNRKEDGEHAGTERVSD